MAALRENLINQNRTRLEEVIPLDMPFSISIDPCNLCNFKCEFCAVQTSDRKVSYKKQMMSMELLEKIVDDLKETGRKLKIIRFATDGEPMLNSDLTKMISYVRDSAVTEIIEIVTNGSCFKPEVNDQIVKCGVDRIRISIEAVDAEGYMKIAHYKMDYGKFIRNIEDLYWKSRGKCEIYVKCVDAALETEEKKRKFYEIYENICDKIYIDNVIPLWSDFQELETKFEIKGAGLHGQKLQKIAVCPYPFYSCVIHPDGDVTVCCADWERKYIIGNVQRENFLSIWNGNKLKRLWIQHLEGKRAENELCAKCLLPEYDCNDNIDEWAPEILKKLK